ncbi:MAG: molybdopterin-binding protein, partial [Pseudomonadota bacterium]|nr:molybdopterin-binding protein [Pseudomonadota bacterium]
MRQRLGTALASRDVLVLSGGVSKGKFDFVPAALKALGVEEVFYQVAQRPGRPMWFGIGPRGQLVFGLPGNPVSTLVCLQRYVLPALRAAMGAPAGMPERLALTEAISGRKMAYFMPVALVAGPGGATQGRPQQPQGSGDFLALAGTAGFVELPPQPEGYPAGFIADLYRW